MTNAQQAVIESKMELVLLRKKHDINSMKEIFFKRVYDCCQYCPLYFKNNQDVYKQHPICGCRSNEHQLNCYHAYYPVPGCYFGMGGTAGFWGTVLDYSKHAWLPNYLFHRGFIYRELK